MLPKTILTVVAIELLIGLLAFIIAEDKTQFAETASFLTLVAVIFGAAYLLSRRIRSHKKPV